MPDTWRHRERRPLLLLLLAAAAALSARCAAQGLPPDAAPVGAPAAAQSLTALTAADDWEREWSSNRAAALCRIGIGSKCPASTVPLADEALRVATTPRSFFRGSSSSLDQGDCLTCASFAVASAADMAVATALQQLGRPVTPFNTLSVQDLHFCALDEGVSRGCKSPVTIKEALDALVKKRAQLVAPRCLAYRPDVPPSELCRYACHDVSKELLQGRFEYQRLAGGATDIQRWLHAYGGVVSAMTVHADFRPFFKANPKGVYSGPDPKVSGPKFGHAVQIVGWGNGPRDACFIAKNSWGPSFAQDGGIFQIKITSSDIGGLDTWGIRFVPTGGLPPPVTKPAARAGCELYTGAYGEGVGDAAAKFAGRFAGLTERSLLADNAAALASPRDVAGKELLLCSPGAAKPDVPAQARALLAVKQAIDARGSVLSSWSAANAAGSTYCSWEGVDCVGADVTSITLLNMRLGGSLPSLAGLPKLTTLGLGGNGLTGTLPAEWATLQELEVVGLAGNKLSGSVPQAWWAPGAMKRLTALNLQENKGLSGCFPAAARTRKFTLLTNGLTLEQSLWRGTSITGWCRK